MLPLAMHRVVLGVCSTPMAIPFGLDIRLLEALSDAIVVLDAEGSVQFVNSAARSAFGHLLPSPAGRIEGLDIDECFRLSECGTDISSALAAALRGERAVVECDLPIEGRCRAMEFVFNPLVDDGQVQQVILVGRDVENRAQVQRQREQLFALVENSSDFIGMADAEGTPFYVNPAGRRMVGIAQAEVPHTSIPDYYPADQIDLVNDQILPRMRSDGYWSGETFFRNFATGARIPVSDTHFVVRHPETGELIGYATITRDISEQKRSLELSEASKQKDRFLATLAHELRNPLAPIRTGLDLIQVLRGDAAACEEPLRIIDRQFQHLVHLVDDLLDVSRISRGKIELHKEQLELAEIIDAALEMSDSGLNRGDRRVTVSVPSEPLVVEGDPVRLVQVIANLLNNAAKFTDAGGHIDVRATPRDDWVEIQVQDDGCGVPRERLDKIFEMFSQAEPGRSGGLGIGLSLVRGLVEMHGGTVSADSAGPGCGATFTVSLPLSSSVPVQATAETATEPGALPTQCRLLVVDDNPDIVESLRLVLTMLGAEVRVAHDGADAIRVFDEWTPTHVLMDLGMPGMDGYEAARRLRAKHADSAFRLIAMTGWGQEEDRRRTREAGFDEHLVKPVRLERLKEVLSA
ncbi:MAG: PAS domain-containing sensor histidine kinase [Thioalkalivibrio sp.]|nr:MAG: PAS domain-containing sensor histidine kinase [Thioalkalivibrio sp.]